MATGTPLPPADALTTDTVLPARAGRAGQPLRRWGRVLLVGAVVTACAVPAGDALAAGRGDRRPEPRPAPRPAAGSAPARHRAPDPAVTPSASPTSAVDPVAGGGTTGEEPLRRSGEDLRWWPWGPVVSGRLSRPVQGGWSTLVLQRGEITAVGAGTVTVTSPDGLTVVWTLTSSTRITGLGKGHGPGPKGPRSSSGEPTADPTAPPSPPPAADPAAGLAVHQRVGIWGNAAGEATTASFVVVRGTATPPPSPSPSASPPGSPPPTATSTIE